MRGLRKLLVIGVTLGLYSSVVAPAHANTVITYQLLPDLQGISEVDIRVNFALHIYTTFPGDENFSIAGDGLNQFIGQGNYDVFMHELDISPPYTGGLLFELRSAQEGTDYVYVHTVGSEGGCTDGLCTVIDFLAGAFSVSQFPHDPAIQIVFTNDTGGLQEIGSYVNDSGNVITFMVQTPTNVVPLPAALPLFASGLGVMGWLARRRKRDKATQELSAA